MNRQNETEKKGLKAINSLFERRLNKFTLARPQHIIKKYKTRFFIEKDLNHYLEITYAIDTLLPTSFSFFKVSDVELITKLQRLPRHQPIIEG